jgi:predicted metal-dependent hydrolase
MSDLIQLDFHVCEGLRLFNKGLYFESHEALEIAWRAEKGPTRDLYRGILQAAVCYLHITRNNHTGAVKMFERSRKWLSKWPEVALGIHVRQLREDMASVIAQIESSNLVSSREEKRYSLKPIIFDQERCISQKPGEKKTSKIRCDRCGSLMIAGNCKVSCPNCGNRLDCSDLNIYFDELI